MSTKQDPWAEYIAEHGRMLADIQRLTEFRHQHRDCDRMGVLVQQIEDVIRAWTRDDYSNSAAMARVASLVRKFRATDSAGAVLK